jgi:hypothetical protein
MQSNFRETIPFKELHDLKSMLRIRMDPDLTGQNRIRIFLDQYGSGRLGTDPVPGPVPDPVPDHVPI